MDELEQRIEELRAQEELDALRPELDGVKVMEHLGVAPGPDVGQALDFLMELRLDEGPLGEEEARRRLDAWWAQQGDGQGATVTAVSPRDAEARTRRRRTPPPGGGPRRRGTAPGATS